MTKESNKNLPAYLEKMNAEILELNFKTESLRMSFNPDEFFCHSDGTILQGGSEIISRSLEVNLLLKTFE